MADQEQNERIAYGKDSVNLHGEFTVDELKAIIREMNTRVQSSPLMLQLIGSRREDLDARVASGELTVEQAQAQYRSFVSEKFKRIREREVKG